MDLSPLLLGLGSALGLLGLVVLLLGGVALSVTDVAGLDLVGPSADRIPRHPAAIAPGAVRPLPGSPR